MDASRAIHSRDCRAIRPRSAAYGPGAPTASSSPRRICAPPTPRAPLKFTPGDSVFAGKIVTCQDRLALRHRAASDDWQTTLLGFGWLRHLRAADSAITRANARSLVDEWLMRQGRSQAAAWRPEVLARRVMSFLSQAPLVLTDSDGRFYKRYLRGLTREVSRLRGAMREVGDGVPRLQVLIALCYASLCLARHEPQIKSAARRLSDELARQILPDGGHISRNPAALIELLLDLLPLRQTFAARNVMPPEALLNAIDRMMPMLRFFSSWRR